jgi:hypothetical protein
VRLGSFGVSIIAGGLLAIGFGGCELNPQPEVPNSTVGGSDSGMGGFGNAAGGGGTGANVGLDAGAGAGGTTAPACNPGCESGELCSSGKCIDDPCDPNSCEADQACKPNADFSASNCFASCAGVTCEDDETCVDGVCKVEECGGCAAGEVCQPADDGGFACDVDPCVTDAAPRCNAGESCDPVSGACTVDPCTGVKCPEGQSCASGQCQFDGDAAPGDAG